MKTRIIGFILMVLFLVSCSTSRTIVSNSAELDKYKYASLKDVTSYYGSAALMDIEVKIYDAVSDTRLEMVGDKRIIDLTPIQKSAVIACPFLRFSK